MLLSSCPPAPVSPASVTKRCSFTSHLTSASGDSAGPSSAAHSPTPSQQRHRQQQSAGDKEADDACTNHEQEESCCVEQSSYAHDGITSAVLSEPSNFTPFPSLHSASVECGAGDAADDDDRLHHAKRQRRRLAFSVFVDPEDHPDNHVMRHLSLASSGTAEGEGMIQRERCVRLGLLLSSHPLFKSLSPELTRRMFREFVREKREAGAVLATAGQRSSDVFHVIDSGEVLCEYESEEALLHACPPTVLTKRAGDTLGDLALMHPCSAPLQMSARVSNSGPVFLFSIDGGIFRYLLSHGMQERYQQLKAFFHSLPLFAADARGSSRVDTVENLIESATVLEFAAGEIIVPAPVSRSLRSPSPLLSPSPPLLSPQMLDDSMDIVTPVRASTHPVLSSPTTFISASPAAALPSPGLMQRYSSGSSSATSSAFGVSLGAFAAPQPACAAASVAAMPSPLPSYLSHCVFLVQEGTVGISRAHAPPQLVGAREVFGLEILSCPHRLLDLSSRFACSPHSVSPSFAPAASSSAISSPKSSRKRVRMAEDLEQIEPVHFTSTPPASLASAAQPPLVSALPPLSPLLLASSSASSCASSASSRDTSAISPLPPTLRADAAVSACGCRGEIRCVSASALLVAVDARVWKQAIMQAI